MTDGEEAVRRREFRAWVRAHHPDAGGDPDEFAAGLARWRERLVRPADSTVPDAAVSGGTVSDAPVSGGTPPEATVPEVSVFRIRGGLWAARRWWRRRRQPPRVR